MKLKILGFFVSALFIFSAFGGFAYGKKMMTTQEKISIVSTVFDQTDKIAVIIDTDLYSRVSQKFDRYMTEIEGRFPVTFTFYEVDNGSKVHFMDLIAISLVYKQEW